jgi:translation initiation factor IF-3
LKRDKSEHSKSKIVANNNIRAREILCINQNDENVGIIMTSRALKMAADAGLDLIQVSFPDKSTPPTCKIIDYGKYKYDISKRQKSKLKKQRESLAKTKEIKFRPTTGMNDLQVKAKKVGEFLQDGCNVKISIVFKGREISHKGLAIEKLNDFVSIINGLDVMDGSHVQLSDSPKLNGRSLIAMLVHKKSMGVSLSNNK